MMRYEGHLKEIAADQTQITIEKSIGVVNLSHNS